MSALTRLLAIVLLAVFGLPAVLPLFVLAEGDAAVPVCCRRSGAHHCMGSAEDKDQSGNHDPWFRAPAVRCPYSPSVVADGHSHAFGPPAAQAIFADLVAHPAVAAQTESKLRIARSRSRQKRGPPISFFL